MRKALLADVEQLVTMMGEFYSESPYTDLAHLSLSLAEPTHAP
jgi:hypothetical protein